MGFLFLMYLSDSVSADSNATWNKNSFGDLPFEYTTQTSLTCGLRNPKNRSRKLTGEFFQQPRNN